MSSLTKWRHSLQYLDYSIKRILDCACQKIPYIERKTDSDSNISICQQSGLNMLSSMRGDVKGKLDKT